MAAAETLLAFVGYGDWRGLASATLIGVGQWARQAVHRAFPEDPRTTDRPRG